MHKTGITVYLWEESLYPAFPQAQVHTPELIWVQSPSFMQSPANKTFLPQVVELIIGIFIFSHSLKIKSLVQLFKHSQSPYWQTESTYLSINYSKLSNQFNNTLKTAAKCHLFCLSKPFNLLSLSIFQGLFILTRFHIFPLECFLVSSKWMPAACALQIWFPSLLHRQVDHKHLKNQTSGKAHMPKRHPSKTHKASYLCEHESSVLQWDGTHRFHNNPFSHVVTASQHKITTDSYNKTSQVFSTDFSQNKLLMTDPVNEFYQPLTCTRISQFSLQQKTEHIVQTAWTPTSINLCTRARSFPFCTQVTPI